MNLENRLIGFSSRFAPLIKALMTACHRHYGDNLVSLAIFGSLGRGTAGPESDVDVLIVCRELPRGRLARVQDFATHVEPAVEPILRSMADQGIHTYLSPVFKTTDEIEAGSPLLLDMVEDALILYDDDQFLARRLRRLQERLTALGARRIWWGERWYWDLKPDYQVGEEFEV